METEDVQALQRIADIVYSKTGDLIADGERPFAVAAVFSMVALQIYKTLLSPEEYNLMVDSISDSRHSIIALTDALKLSTSKSIH